MVMRAKCHNLRRHYFLKISPQGWMWWTLLRQHAIEAFGVDLDSHEAVVLLI